MRKLLTAFGLSALVASSLEGAEAWRPIGRVVDPSTGSKLALEAYFDSNPPAGHFNSVLSICGEVLSVESVTGEAVGPSELCVSKSGEPRFRMIADGPVTENFINCLVAGKGGKGGINPTCQAQFKKNRERSMGLLRGGVLTGVAMAAAGTLTYYFCPLPRINEAHFNNLKFIISRATPFIASCIAVLGILNQESVLHRGKNKQDEIILAFMTICTVYTIGRILQYSLKVSREACHGRAPIKINQLTRQLIRDEISRIEGLRRSGDGPSFEDRALVLQRKYENLQIILAKFSGYDALKKDLNKFHADLEEFVSAHDCPISLSIMNDPITPSDSGHTYDRLHYEAHQRRLQELNRPQTDPLSATTSATATLVMAVAGLSQPLATNVDRRRMIANGLVLLEERLKPLEAQIQALVPAQAIVSAAATGAGVDMGSAAEPLAGTEGAGLRNRS